ncbi:MAG: hypothetical protein KDK39_12920 [Leptospiraceae bacterium]|nr:hypothetical protein [Leptospiraceae bacterium]
MKSITLTLLLFLFPGAFQCASEAADPLIWNEDLQLYSWQDRLYATSKQHVYDESFLSALAQKDIRYFIDVDSEASKAIEENLALHDIEYIHASFFCDKENNSYCPQNATRALQKIAPAKTIVACNHGTKAGAWLAVYLIQNQGMEAKQATASGLKIVAKDPAMQAKATAMIKAALAQSATKP